MEDMACIYEPLFTEKNFTLLSFILNARSEQSKSAIHDKGQELATHFEMLPAV